MNMLYRPFSRLAICAGLAGQIALAQDPPAPSAPLHSPDPSLGVPHAPPAPPASGLSHSGVPHARVLLAQSTGGGFGGGVGYGGGGGGGGGEFVFSQTPEAGNWSGGAFTLENPLGTARPRTLVIRSGEADENAVSSLEEDLNVMTRILTKALKEKNTSDEDVTAMGMQIRTFSWTGQGAPQSLYLDGYGALFVLNVRFPLLAPPKNVEEETTKEPVDSTWEEAKQEIYGSRHVSSKRIAISKREEFDPKKVAALKEGLVKALKNATHIRNLKPDEFVTVALVGSGVGSNEYRVVNSIQNKVMTLQQVERAVGSPASHAGESHLTMRVKKADVDAFAKGNLDLEKFKTKVSMTVY